MTRGERYLHGLQRARQLASLGARLRTIHVLTGLQPRFLQTLFFPDSDRIPRGRAPDSGEWYHQANLVRQIDACLLAVGFRALRATGWPSEDALIASYRAYRMRAGSRTSISLDRAYSLVSHLEGMWQARSPSLALDQCQRCACLHLAPVGLLSGTSRDCPFCKLKSRFACDPRLRLAFAPSAHLAWQAEEDAASTATAPPHAMSMAGVHGTRAAAPDLAADAPRGCHGKRA